MSVRQRPSISQQPSVSLTTTGGTTNNAPETPKSPSRPPSLSQRAISQTLTTTANLANLLPTGTLLAFQLLTPIFTNNGACDNATRPMTLFLLLLLAVSCFLASFTDSVKSSDGQVYYGLATTKGLFLFDYPDPSGVGLPDLSKYKIRFIDGVHAVLSVLVFGAFALRDKNVLTCFYPTPDREIQEVLNILPVGVGLICSLLFMVFPTRRHGIGYPITPGR
ncbi:protein DMP3-like [Mangifera indica]|uniref:protein DMP3-like n=1 Tax=Mangifera indica TaxID=29780 RepID=UPI001CFAC97F|nr:protein DMP3-like [Mangifera indica]